jgi:hypothetical protein
MRRPRAKTPPGWRASKTARPNNGSAATDGRQALQGSAVRRFLGVLSLHPFPPLPLFFLPLGARHFLLVFMPRTCAAFNPTRHLPRCWTRCPRPALRDNLFCSRHRRALDGAILGILQVELRAVRARAREAAHERAPRNAFDGAAGGTARKSRTVVCTQCGTIWQKEAYIRQQQNLEAEESYRSRPK